MFVALWEYEVKSGCEETFQSAYGPQGDCVTVADEGEVQNGSAMGFSQNSRDKWVRAENDMVV